MLCKHVFPTHSCSVRFRNFYRCIDLEQALLSVAVNQSSPKVEVTKYKATFVTEMCIGYNDGQGGGGGLLPGGLGGGQGGSRWGAAWIPVGIIQADKRKEEEEVMGSAPQRPIVVWLWENLPLLKSFWLDYSPPELLDICYLRHTGWF